MNERRAVRTYEYAGALMRVLFILNERAGSGQASAYELVRLLGASGAEITARFVADDRAIDSLVADVLTFDRVVAAGGDGTVSGVCYAMRGTGVPVLAYPGGTANLVAANLGLPAEAGALAQVVLDGHASEFDIGELARADATGGVARSGFLVMAGAGYDAQIMRVAEPLKPALGAVAYLVGAVSNLAPTPARFDVTMDGEEVSLEGIACVIVNFARIQFDLPVTPQTDPRDGLLQVAIVKTRTPVGLLPVIAAAVMDRTGDHPDRSPAMDVFSGRTIQVTVEPPLSMQSDGDVLGETSGFTASVLPRQATLLLPAGSPYL